MGEGHGGFLVHAGKEFRLGVLAIVDQRLVQPAEARCRIRRQVIYVQRLDDVDHEVGTVRRLGVRQRRRHSSLDCRDMSRWTQRRWPAHICRCRFGRCRSRHGILRRGGCGRCACHRNAGQEPATAHCGTRVFSCHGILLGQAPSHRDEAPPIMESFRCDARRSPYSRCCWQSMSLTPNRLCTSSRARPCASPSVIRRAAAPIFQGACSRATSASTFPAESRDLPLFVARSLAPGQSTFRLSLRTSTPHFASSPSMSLAYSSGVDVKGSPPSAWMRCLTSSLATNERNAALSSIDDRSRRPRRCEQAIVQNELEPWQPGTHSRSAPPATG